MGLAGYGDNCGYCVCVCEKAFILFSKYQTDMNPLILLLTVSESRLANVLIECFDKLFTYQSIAHFWIDSIAMANSMATIQTTRLSSSALPPPPTLHIMLSALAIFASALIVPRNSVIFLIMYDLSSQLRFSAMIRICTLSRFFSHKAQTTKQNMLPQLASEMPFKVQQTHWPRGM